MEPLSNISHQLEEIRNRIRSASERAGRDPADICLIAVSKGQPLPAVRDAFSAGQRDFGENYLAEAEEKWRSGPAGISWHMIGHVQSRKAKWMPRYFVSVHSVDSRTLAERLSRFAVEERRTLEIFLECNVSGEESKFGWPAADANAWPNLIESWRPILTLPGLSIAGLMTMAPYSRDPETSRPVFQILRRLRDQACQQLSCPALWGLSMGMSDDFEQAVEEGASHLRIGRAIFGERKNPPPAS
jgi:pyridoxal phosphate enzyme (YggS family)